MKQDIKTPFQALIYAEFGADELNVFKSFCRNTKAAYSTTYRNSKTKKESPSEWLARKKKGLSLNDEMGKRINIEFGSSELEYYKNLNSRHKISYSAYMRLRTEANKEITSNDAPSEWHKRYLTRKAGGKVKRGHYVVRRCKNGRKFVENIINRFSYDEGIYYENMIDFSKRYYNNYFRMCSGNSKLKKPSEWYEEFAVATQCREMKQLENRFFALVKREISRQDAKEYIAYFEAMAYQRERNYCL